MDILLIIISLSVLIIIHEIGHFGSAKFFKVKVDEFGVGFPPRIFAKKKGDTTYSINALPFGGFVKIAGEDGSDVTEERKDASLFSSQKTWKRGVILAGGVFMNLVAGWIIVSVVFMSGVPVKLVVLDVFPDSPAAKADMQANDFIIKAERGGVILENPIQTEDFIRLVKEAGDNPISLTLERGGEILEKTVNGRENPPEGQGSLGIGLGQSGVERKGFFSALLEGAKYTAEMTFAITRGFFDLIGSIFTSPENLKHIAGPVGIVVIAKQATEIGFVYFLQLMALISINLAVLNLLPFPALDGGRILVLLIEKIKGSPVSLRIQSYVNVFGFLLLIALMIFVTFQDVAKLFK